MSLNPLFACKLAIFLSRIPLFQTQAKATHLMLGESDFSHKNTSVSVLSAMASEMTRQSHYEPGL